MIVERAAFTIFPGREADFETAIGRACDEEIRHAHGFRELKLSRGIEEPSTYLLLVAWDRLEDHTVGFRQSERYPRWRALVAHFFAEAPTVSHFEAPTVIR